MLPHEGERNAMMAKRKTPQAKETYKLRQQTVEPVIGDIKEEKGLKWSLTRGIMTVRTEFNLVCAAANIRKIWAKLQEENTGGREPVCQQA